MVVNPTPKVELSTVDPAGTPSWQDISAYVLEDGIQTSRGRSSELDRFQAGTGTIQLNNNDGRFDPTYASSPYFPNLRPLNRIRVSAVWNAVTYPVLTGYANGWTPEYPGPRNSLVNLQVTDAFAVLAIPNVQLSNPAIATDNLTSLPEERTDIRIGRILDAVGWPAGDRSLSAGASIVLPQNELSSLSALAYIQLIEQSANGRFWIRNDGVAKWLNRWDMGLSPYSTSQATFGQTGTDLRYANVIPSYDLTFIRNEIRLTSLGLPAPLISTLHAAEEVAQVAKDTTSQGHYYRRTLEESGLLVTANELSDAAAYILSRYKDPQLRFITLELEGRADPTNQWPQLLGRELSDRITLKFSPPGRTGTITQDCFIEGIQQNWTRDLWRTTWQLSAFGIGYQIYPVGKSFLQLGDATLGLIGAGANGVLVY